jgi:hypothetical protein
VTGEIVNLNKARKARSRQAAKAQASQNRVKFGLAKADKTLAARRAAIEDARLEAHRRDED